jgi:hypothetical protein
MPQIFPQDKYAGYEMQQLEDVNHYTSWVDASLGDGKTTSHFGYAGRLTEAVLLGAVAVRFAGQRLEWDAPSGKFTKRCPR